MIWSEKTQTGTFVASVFKNIRASCSGAAFLQKWTRNFTTWQKPKACSNISQDIMNPRDNLHRSSLCPSSSVFRTACPSSSDFCRLFLILSVLHPVFCLFCLTFSLSPSCCLPLPGVSLPVVCPLSSFQGLCVSVNRPETWTSFNHCIDHIYASRLC